MFFLLWLLLSICHSSLGASSSFVSVETLAATYEAEGEIVEKLQKMMDALKEKIDILERHSAEHVYTKEPNSCFPSLSHPINRYVAIKSLARQWKQIRETTKEIQLLIADSFSEMDDYREKIGFPTKFDLDVTMKSIVIAGEMYSLDIPMLTEGDIKDLSDKDKVHRSLFKLSSSDCFDFAQSAYDMGIFDSTIAFCEASLETWSNGDGRTKEEIRELMKNATEERNEMEQVFENRRKGIADPEDYVSQDPEAEEGTEEGSSGELTEDRSKETEKKIFYEPLTPEKYQELVDLQFKEDEQVNHLCSQPTSTASPSFDQPSCRYFTNNNPYLLIGPMKVEEYSMDPYVVMIHDMMYESEIETMKNTVVSKLNTSLLYTGATDGRRGLTSRTSHTAWIADRAAGGKITNRIEAVTGLNAYRTRAAEAYQVVNYGVGGQFVSHHDFLQDSDYYGQGIVEIARGDRIATVMTYLSDVEAGGATVFPQLGITLVPRKGSAAFWWNLKRDGTGDDASEHAGCPVLVGSKWISNKWIHVYDQMFKAPCSLDDEARFDAKFWDISYRS